ncbi:uncharacterized protein F4812DRAFT_348144 [Daldinia caldariorum]|uniref:uncharacterized protein n=1 Tax=Daldinia caldariorum TaxID=326644 RepID=UPI0020077679|nr:uncharacterized protein F4812DRAFT_348144 [Daldinia caldariorum]KAI1468831.1 hypothetical protein F4812DRAFT_348144 [Daldinia caldariorum]
MSSAPFLLLSPALPSELLTYILSHHIHPTTLIICSSRSDFLASLAADIFHEPACHDEVASAEHSVGSSPPPPPGAPPEAHDDTKQEQGGRQEPPHHHPLLSSPLHQIATSRHIRVVYVPTVTHLRAYLSVFSPDDSRVPVPPAGFNPSGKYAPCIILYGFLEMHRDTSEWSAQGLGDSASAVVELGHRLSWQTIVVEPRKHGVASPFEDLLRENVPFLSGGGRRLGPDMEAGWTGRTVEVGRVMKRWFCFQLGEWDDISSDERKVGASKEE